MLTQQHLVGDAEEILMGPQLIIEKLDQPVHDRLVVFGDQGEQIARLNWRCHFTLHGRSQRR